MYEWVAVVLAGVIGGFFSTLLPAGTDAPSPPFVGQIVDKNRALGFLYHLLRNSVFGGMASFLLWGGYSPGVTFAKTDPAVQQIAASLIFGGGGVGIINTLFRQAQQNQTIRNLADVIELQDKQAKRL